MKKELTGLRKKDFDTGAKFERRVIADWLRSQAWMHHHYEELAKDIEDGAHHL